MRTSNGPCIALNGHSVDTTSDVRNTSQVTSAQAEFISFVLFHGIKELCTSLRQAHDWALYHSDIPFDTQEKNVLFDLKILWEEFERMDRTI